MFRHAAKMLSFVGPGEGFSCNQRHRSNQTPYTSYIIHHTSYIRHQTSDPRKNTPTRPSSAAGHQVHQCGLIPTRTNARKEDMHSCTSFNISLPTWDCWSAQRLSINSSASVRLTMWKNGVMCKKCATVSAPGGGSDGSGCGWDGEGVCRGSRATRRPRSSSGFSSVLSSPSRAASIGVCRDVDVSMSSSGVDDLSSWDGICATTAS
jgi:hypothetical protein